MSDRRPDLRWEILPIFEVVIAFSLGLILHAHRMDALKTAGPDHYGPDGWEDMSAWIRWGIPAIALGAYLLLSLLAWLATWVNPFADVNLVRRRMGKPELTDPAQKEAMRGRLLRSVYLCKVVIGAVALFAQWFFCNHLIQELGRGGF